MKKVLFILMIAVVLAGCGKKEAAPAAKESPFGVAELPSFVLNDLSGSAHNLQDYKGKVLIIDSGPPGALPAGRRSLILLPCRTSTERKAWKSSGYHWMTLSATSLILSRQTRSTTPSFTGIRSGRSSMSSEGSRGSPRRSSSTVRGMS